MQAPDKNNSEKPSTPEAATIKDQSGPSADNVAEGKDATD